MSLSRRLFAVAAAVGFLALGPVSARAQAIAPPHPSVLRTAARTDSAAADSVPHIRWTQANGALVGGMIGVVAGLLGAYALRNDVYSSAGLYLKGATVFGALGIALGSLAGAEAEGK